MLLDIDQKPGVLDISYLNSEGNKAIMQIPVPQYYRWEIDKTGHGTPGYIDIGGRPVVRKWAKSFRTFDLLQFLKTQPKEVLDELFAYRTANLISCDIETKIGEGFPKPELAEEEVNCIGNVDQNMNILIYTTCDCSHPVTVVDVLPAEPNEPGAYEETVPTQVADIAAMDHAAGMKLLNDGNAPDELVPWPTGKWLKNIERTVDVREEVDAIIAHHIKQYLEPHEQNNIHATILQFDTERQMLEAWWGNVCKFGSVLAFWNGDGFDKPYMVNRANKLGIDLRIGSITGEVASMTGLPKHTIFTDYMFMVDEYDRSIKNKESLRLDYISQRVLGIGKLPYKGTLKELYTKNIPTFLAYNAIDCIVQQLLHRRLNLMATLYGFSNVCKMPLVKANSQVAQTEHLISLDTLDMLDMTGIEVAPKPDLGGVVQVAAFNPDKPPRRKYDGGHVKEPHKHVAHWCACVDYSGLYPSCHRSCNISVENYIGPLSNFSPRQQKQILDDTEHYFVSVNHKVYKNDHDYAYKRIQIYLRAKRDFHKKRMNFHLSKQQPFIEKALHERGLWKDCPVVDESIESLVFPVFIDGKEYDPDLVHLNNPGDQDGYEHHTNFLWFLFHENLRLGFYEMNQQVSYKLVANSLYGATANEFNAFSNVDVADDTTAEGRNSILTGEKLINNYFNFEFATDHAAHKWLLDNYGSKVSKVVEGDMEPMPIRDRIMYIDTDSCYLEFDDIIEYVGLVVPEHEPDRAIIEFFVDFYSNYFGPIVEQRLHEQLNMRGGQSMQAFDLEAISERALFRKKKSYMKTNSWDDGRFYNHDDAFAHLKTTGFVLARSSMSVKCRDAVKKAVIAILATDIATTEQYHKYMAMLWQDFQTWSIEDISKRLSIRRDQYRSHILGFDPWPIFAPRTLPQYRGAAFYNAHIKQRGLAEQLEPIEEGFVCFYEDVFGNPFAYRYGELPTWHPKPNKAIMFYKQVADAIRDVAIYYGIDTNISHIVRNDVTSSMDEFADEDD